MKIQVLCIAFLLSWSAGMAQMNPQGLNINDKAPQFKAKANDRQYAKPEKGAEKRTGSVDFLPRTMVPLLQQTI